MVCATLRAVIGLSEMKKRANKSNRPLMKVIEVMNVIERWRMCRRFFLGF